jgi:hypothetical protein
LKIIKEVTKNRSTAADICTKLNKKARDLNNTVGEPFISPSHVDYVPPIHRIQKTIDNIYRSLRHNMTDVELVHQWLDENQDIVVHPKHKKDYPTIAGIYIFMITLLIYIY